MSSAKPQAAPPIETAVATAKPGSRSMAGRPIVTLTPLAILLALLVVLILPGESRTGCLGNLGYILVKTPYNSYISVANPDCSRNYSYSISSFSLTLQSFSPSPPVTIWGGSGDPNVHDANPLTTFPPQFVGGGYVGPYQINTHSLKDLGTYTYLFEGYSIDSSAVIAPMQSEAMGFLIGKSHPTATLSVAGTLKVSNTITFNAAASDPDPGALHYSWTVIGRPAGSVANLTNPTAAAPTMSLASKHDIGDWSVKLDLADAQGELKEFTKNFTVVNQPPTLAINGPTTIDALEHIHLEADPAKDADGEDITWVWDIVSSPPGASHAPQSNFSTSQVIDFVTGPKDIGTWTFKCTATDEHGAHVDQTATVTVKAVPPKISLVGAKQIKVGETIHFETTTLDDAYGAPLRFTWDIYQVPVTAGIGLTPGYSTGPSVDIPTSATYAGTWRFKLTVTDQVNQTAEQEALVLVDGLPTAVILGPDQTGNLSLPLDLDGSSSSDPDSPTTPPDFGHLHIGPPQISPGIVEYKWSIVSVPAELFGDYYPGPVADVLGIDGSGPTLHIPAGKLKSGDWVFGLEVVDGEGNHVSADHAVQVLDESLPPLPILIGEQSYTTDVNGVLAADVVLDGSLSFDPDNLLNSPYQPGLGITNYEWKVVLAPPTCTNPPSLPSGPGATTAKLYTAGSAVPPACQGVYLISLTVTDDDTPTPRKATTYTVVRIGNCPGAICIDYPTQAAPQAVKFSDQTDVVIYFHLSSLLYDDPSFAAGMRLRLELFHESDPVHPAYDKTWDVDLLPSDKGGVLAVHWSGFNNLNQRPQPGKYTITLQLVDPAGNPTGYSATQPQAVWIQTLNVQVAAGTDTFLNCNGLADGSDGLLINYNVTGQLPGDSGYDELRFRIYDKTTSAKVFEDARYSPFTGGFTWNGDLGSSTYLDPGKYQLELEILDGGASLGVSSRSDFRAYKIDLGLSGIADPDKLTPGAFLKEGDTLTATLKLDNDAGTLPGNATLKTESEPGTLSAQDGATPVDVDAGVTLATASLSGPKAYAIKGAGPGSAGKTTLSASYQPPGTAASKKAVSKVAVTVVRAHIRAVSSDPNAQATDGIFLPGSRSPVAVTPGNVEFLKYQMRPVKVEVRPDVSGGAVELAFDSGAANNLELYAADPPHPQLVLPKTWAQADFNAHKLEVPLLAYGKDFGEVVLRLTYKNNGTTLAEEKIKVRVAPFPGAVGVELPGQFPFFRVLRTGNAGGPVKAALDPLRHKERVGRKAAVYVVAHKKPDEWAADPTLTDVTGGPKVITVTPGSIALNVTPVWPAAAAGVYDVVYDFGSFPDDPNTFATDGKLDPGDILDSADGTPSVVVEGSATAPGPAPFSTAVYGMVGPATTPVPVGYDGLTTAFSFRLRGQVVYPTVLAGPAPLVVFAHGNHNPRTITDAGVVKAVSADLTSDENFKGHTYLQEHLASRGYITLSVDLDEMYGLGSSGTLDFGGPKITGPGIQLRAWVILKNIEKVLSDPTIAGVALAGKIDTSRIYLVGHSRGGEAVIVAYHFLKTPAARPAGGTLAGFAAAGIKGIVSISPVTAAISLGPVTFQDIPFLLLYGSADGDVNGALDSVAPFRHYDRAVGDKFAIRIVGADHNHFNTSWGYSDAAENFPIAVPADFFMGTKVPLPVPVGANLVAGPAQRDTAKAYLAMFLQMIDKGDVGASSYFLEPPAALRPLGVDPALNLSGQARRQTGVSKTVADDYETNPSPLVSSSGQAVSFTVSDLFENSLFDPNLLSEIEPQNRFFQETKGVLFSWSASAEYVEALVGADQNLLGAQVISFRLAQQPKHPNTVMLGGPMSFAVEVEDDLGKTSAINVKALDTVPAIYTAKVPGVGETTSAAFQTFRIPVAGFATDGKDINLAKITKIRLRLANPGDSAQGRVGFDDLEIEK